MEPIIVNLIIVFGLTVLGFFFGREDDRTFSAVWVFAITFGISFWGWVFFVAYHFITFYWNGV